MSRAWRILRNDFVHDENRVARKPKAAPAFGTNLTYPLERYPPLSSNQRHERTPLRWLDTPESWELDGRELDGDPACGGSWRGRPIYFAFLLGLSSDFGWPLKRSERLGCLCLPGGGLSSAARVWSILDNEATILCCTPTYAIRLAEVAAQEKISSERLAGAHVDCGWRTGRSVPSVRAQLAALWRERECSITTG
jgi:phenylacetate-CoA ligase